MVCYLISLLIVLVSWQSSLGALLYCLSLAHFRVCIVFVMVVLVCIYSLNVSFR